MGRTAVAIELSESERRELESLASRRKTAQGLAQRARIVLLAAEGLENKDISLRVEAAPNTVGKWRRRFAEFRVAEHNTVDGGWNSHASTLCLLSRRRRGWQTVEEPNGLCDADGVGIVPARDLSSLGAVKPAETKPSRSMGTLKGQGGCEKSCFRA